MVKLKLEYIWLDGFEFMQGLCFKIKIVKDFSGVLEDCLMWFFDGSFINQVEGGVFDCLFRLVVIYLDFDCWVGFLVMCEVLNVDGMFYLINGWVMINDDDVDFWFGFEQEYFFWDLEINKLLGFFVNGYLWLQGLYYCFVGVGNVYGWEVIEEYFDLCIDVGLNIEGINVEVVVGQWEFQVFVKGVYEVGDQVWVACYLLECMVEKYGLGINWYCKFLQGDWNGLGMYVNFFNFLLWEVGSCEVYDMVCQAFGVMLEVIKVYIEVYGEDNYFCLIGLYEM